MLSINILAIPDLCGGAFHELGKVSYADHEIAFFKAPFSVTAHKRKIGCGKLETYTLLLSCLEVDAVEAAETFHIRRKACHEVGGEKKHRTRTVHLSGVGHTSTVTVSVSAGPNVSLLTLRLLYSKSV